MSVKEEDCKMKLTTNIVINETPKAPKIQEEFKKMTDSGFKNRIELLRKENQQLKSALLQIQESLCDPVNKSLEKLQKLP